MKKAAKKVKKIRLKGKVASEKIVKQKFNKLYNTGLVMAELPPCKRTIFFTRGELLYVNGRLIDRDCRSLFLSFPTIRIVIGYGYNPKTKTYSATKFKLAFYNKNKKKLLVPPLPNIFEDLKVCGTTAKKCNSIEELVKKQVSMFFSSKFNFSAADCLEAYTESYTEYLLDWEKSTKNDPDWIPSKFQEYSDPYDFDDPEKFYA